MGEVAIVEPKHGRTRFICTGFGTFFGVAANPTEKLLEYIGVYAPDHLPGGADLAACKIVKVDAHKVNAALIELSASLPSSDHSSNVIWIHFGVNVGSDHFDLERFAYNEATFRCADQGGWQPTRECITGDAPLGECMETDLPLADLAEALNTDSKGQYTVEVSVDPGRFVCNFIYFSSLRQAAAHSGWRVLFVHVPPFTAVKEELHSQFALGLLKRIAELPALQGASDSASRIDAVKTA